MTDKGDFCITIDFDKSSPNPERIFTAMSEMIKAFKDLDNTLVSAIDSKIQPVLILEDVEVGSLKTWLRQVLNQVDDEALKNLDWKPLVGQYLVKAKYIIIDFLQKRASITDGEEIKQLQGELYRLAENTGVRVFPAYAPIKISELIKGIDKLNKSLSSLDKNDRAYFDTGTERATFNMDFTFSPEAIEDLLTKDSISNTATMILKVKKPDYLGNSKWEFKHDTKTIEAKITDASWVAKFQSRQVDVRPGDSIKAVVNILVKYGHDNAVITTQYEVITVDSIIGNNDNTIMLPL